MRPERSRKPRPPLDQEGLERLALFYAGRYATTRAKLGAYLERKVQARGWEGEVAAQDAVEGLIRRFVDLGYVDDRAFASAKAASLTRRGFGVRRVDQALRVAGIAEEDGAEARDASKAAAFASALRFAERKRIGPYAAVEADREARQKAAAAMMRAGHSLDMVRKILAAAPGEVPELDPE